MSGRGEFGEAGSTISTQTEHSDNLECRISGDEPLTFITGRRSAQCTLRQAFLHGWRRCVCREAQVTLIELNRDTKEIRARHQNKAQHNKTKTNQPQNKPQTQDTKQPGSYLRRAVQAEAKVK